MSSVDTFYTGPAENFVRKRRTYLGAPFDPLTQREVLQAIATHPGTARFRYVVTPNVDHVVRLKENGELRRCYQDAWMSVCDSRPIARLARASSIHLPLVTGSDLTVSLFRSVVQPGDLITLIVGNDKIAEDLIAAYPDFTFRYHVPPPSVWAKPEALKACIDFAAGAPARFVFIAIGSPQSEKIAHELSRRPDARGVGLCVGAALEFLIGSRKRAPRWMRTSGIEWLHRMGTDPKRLWRRYVFAVLPLARLVLSELAGRRIAVGQDHGGDDVAPGDDETAAQRVAAPEGRHVAQKARLE